MFTEQETLIMIVKNIIEEHQKNIEQIMEQNSSTFEKLAGYIKLLEESIDNISIIPYEDIEEVVTNSNAEDREKQLELKYIQLVRQLIELNRTKGTTFQLNQRQKDFINIFIEQLRVAEKTSRDRAKDKIERIDEKTRSLKTFRKVLGIIEDPKNEEYIRQIEDLTNLLSDSEIDTTIQREILYGLLKYNQSIYNDKMSAKTVVEKKRLNKEEVKEVFQTYGYDFLELKEKEQDTLLTYGNLNNIRNVFDCLNTSFPRFDLKRNGNKLVALLINGNAEVIKDIVDYSLVKGLQPQDLLMITPAIIEQAKNKKSTSKEAKDFTSPYITGRSEDFKKNVELLEKIGFTVSYIFRKCKELLIMPHEKLATNYRKFVLYGFTIEQDMYGDLSHPALSCLMSKNFDEIVDQFIEISVFGHQYIKENMSRIMTTTSPQDVLFYNIYASYMREDANGNNLFPEGPFTQDNSKKLKLRGQITRYSGSGYEDIPYRGITEDNKQQMTMTVDIDCANKEEFDAAVEAARGREEELYELVFNDDRILSLEEYTDITDPSRYDFNGILISKQKVKRIYNILKNAHLEDLDDSLLYAITYNSIISQETLDIIKKFLNGRRK